MSMIDELAKELREHYLRPGPSGKVVEIHLFGIRNAAALATLSLPALVTKAGLNESYKTEIRKGMNLALHVVLKK